MDGDGTKNGSARTHEFLDTGPSSSSKDVAAMYGHVLVGGFEAWEGWNSARREPVPLLREDDRNEKGKSTAEAEAVDRRRGRRSLGFSADRDSADKSASLAASVIAIVATKGDKSPRLKPFLRP